MCLITEQKTPLIAEEDVIVYKVLETRLRSYFKYFQYTQNELFETQIREIEKGKTWVSTCSLDGDYLTAKYNVFRVGDLYNNPNLICLKYGFHSCISIEVAKKISGVFIYECVIPKGSEYYKDEVGFLISNKIIIKELISNKLNHYELNN